MLIISFCRPQLFSFLASALIHFAFQTPGADGEAVISRYFLGGCRRRARPPPRLSAAVTGRLLTAGPGRRAAGPPGRRAEVSVFLGSAKWSCDPCVARLSAPADLRSRLASLALLEDADEISLSVAPALAQNPSDKTVARRR